MKQLVVIFFTLVLSSSVFSEILHEWNYQKNNLTGITFSRKQLLPDFNSSEKTPDGSSVLTVKMFERPENGPVHSVQLNYGSKQKIIPGTRYRISFFIKSDISTDIHVSSIVAEAPWSTISDSYRKLIVNEEWQKVNIEFTAAKEYNNIIRTPMFMLGKYPVGGTLSIGPVTFEKLVNSMPLSLNQKWQLFICPELKEFNVEDITEMPKKIGNTEGREITLKNNMVDILALAGTGKFKPKDTAVLINEFNAPSDGVMQVGCAADYWFDFIVNGKSIYNTLITGNIGNIYLPTDHVFNFPVKKGENIIIVKVMSGSHGWKFVCGSVPFQAETNRITKIKRGEKWRPVKMDSVEWTPPITSKRIDQFKIVPGTALDLSLQFPPYNVDKTGRLVISGNGKLTFEKDPATPVRLRGFNFAPSPWLGNFYRMTHAELEELAEQIRLNGMNLLRYHFLDKSLCGKAGPPKQGKDRKSIRDVPMNTSPGTLPINGDFLDRFDYFNKCCRDRGIYILLDIMTEANMGWTASTEPVPMRESFRYGLLISEQYRKNWKAGFDFLMNHVNPFTGKRIIDDPQYIGITFLNEQEHLFSGSALGAFTPEWQKFRNPSNQKSVPAFSRELLEANSADGAAARDYLLGEIEKINNFYLDTARESGFKGLLTNWDMFMRNLEGFARRNMTAVAMHTYFNHPHMVALSPANYKQQSSYAKWLRGKMATVGQSSSIDYRNHYLGRVAATRVFGKPFLMTEISHNGYNRFSHEAGLMQGAYAALQGWDSLLPHANTIGLYYGPFRVFDFDNASNPAAKLASLLTAFIWQRGDVAEAKHSVNFTVPEKVVRSPDLFGSIGSGYNALFMLTKIGSSYDEKDHGATLNITPDSFTVAQSKGMYVVLSEENLQQQRQLEQIIGELKTLNCLPADNRTDVNAGIFQSETGEIIANVKTHTMTVITPRFEAAVQKENVPVKLNALEIESNSIPCSISAIALDKSATLKQSKRILLVLATMFAAEHSVWSNEKFGAELDVGDMQLVFLSGKFKLNFASANKTAPEVYALNMNGTREQKVETRFSNGKLFIDIDTSTLKYGTPYFEVVFK